MQLERCRICRSSELRERIDLGDMAFTGVFPSKQYEVVNTGSLCLVECRKCGLVQLNQNFDPEVLYGPTYGYRSGLNKGMVEHLRKIPNAIKKLVDIKSDDVVLDIGSSDGTLLWGWKDKLTGFPKRIGFDPQAERFRKRYPPGASVFPGFFTPYKFTEISLEKAKAITSVAMFYDLPDPVAFAQDVAACLAQDGIWYTEQAYLPAMLESGGFDTICHEHLEFYGLAQIQTTAIMAGLKIVDFGFNEINGGSFWAMFAHWDSQHEESGLLADAIATEKKRVNDAAWLKFEDRITESKRALEDFLTQTKRDGKRVLGLGASTKGNVLLQHFGINSDHLDAISDVNEDKWGSFTPHPDPEKRIPIVSEEEARAMKPDYFLVLPWHFAEGIIEREREFLQNGGGLVFALPKFKIHQAADAELREIA